MPYLIIDLILSLIVAIVLSIVLIKKRKETKRKTLLVFFLTFFIAQIICCAFFLIYTFGVHPIFHFRDFIEKTVALIPFPSRTLPYPDVLAIDALSFGIITSLIITSLYLLFKTVEPKIKPKKFLTLILISISPILISAIIVHPLSLITGYPAKIKCCEYAAYEPDPSQRTITFFTIIQKIGALICITLALILFACFIGQYLKYKRKKNILKIINLYAAILLFGQCILISIWIAALLVPKSGWRSYIDDSPWSGLGPLPFWFHMGYESVYFRICYLPIISIVTLIYCKHLLSHKTIKTTGNK